MLLDAVEVHWDKQTGSESVLFNDEVDLAVFSTNEVSPDIPYGFVKWRLDHGKAYTYNAPKGMETIKDVYMPSRYLRLIFKDNVKFHITSVQPAANDELAYTLTEFKFNISTKFAIVPEGILFKIGGQSLLLKPGFWEEWYSQEKTLEDFVRNMENDDQDFTRQAGISAAGKQTALCHVTIHL